MKLVFVSLWPRTCMCVYAELYSVLRCQAGEQHRTTASFVDIINTLVISHGVPAGVGGEWWPREGDVN